MRFVYERGLSVLFYYSGLEECTRGQERCVLLTYYLYQFVITSLGGKKYNSHGDRCLGVTS